MIYDKINIMLPSYMRSKTRLPKFIDTCLSTAEDADRLSFCVMTNENDPDTREYLKSRLDGVVRYEAMTENLPKPDFAKYFNTMYDETKFNEPGRLASMVGDDMEFRTEGWDRILLEWVNWFNGMGLFFCDDCKGTGSSLAVNFFGTRKYFDAIKPHPWMCELFPVDDIDVVHDQTARLIKRRFYIEKIKIFHNHATLPGRMDDTWKRSREQMLITQANRAKSPAYVEECVTRIVKALPEEFTSEIDVIMTTHDRLDLLRDTVSSYNAPLEVECTAYREWYSEMWKKYEGVGFEEKPKCIWVFDDGSANPAEVASIVRAIPGVKYDCRPKSLGCTRSTPAALRFMFEENNSKAVLILDSDTTFSKYWWLRANAAYRALKDDPTFGCFSLFNANIAKGMPVDERPGLLKKLAVGAFGMLVTREFWEKYIAPQEVEARTDWDNKACLAAVNDGKVVYSTSPSFLQHTGVYEGSHAGHEAAAYALDFLGLDRSFEKYSVNEKVADESVLFACPGRYGDVIIASMVMNMLIEKGYTVKALTIPRYQDLLELMAPAVKVVRVPESPQMAWWSTSTKHMSEKYPGYKYYVNGQPGSPEHHNNCISSGVHMAWFVKGIAEGVVSQKLPDNWLDYRKIAHEKIVGIQNIKKDRPLAIIAPEVISTKAAISPQLLADLCEQYSHDYDVRILTPTRPPGVPGPIAYRRHLFGYSFIDCIFVLRQCSLFIGNDSGLAWASLFSDCKKIIYHTKKRIAETNVMFCKLDESYEDVVLEGDGNVGAQNG